MQTHLNFPQRAVGSCSRLLRGPDSIRLVSGIVKYDCGGEEAQEWMGVEAAQAMMRRCGDGSPPIWAPSLCLGGAGGCPDTQVPLTPPALQLRWLRAGESSRFPFPNGCHPQPSSGRVQLQPQWLILVTLGPEAGAGQPGSWPQLAGELGLDSVIRRKPEPGHKL